MNHESSTLGVSSSTCSMAYKSEILKFKLHFKLGDEGEDTTGAAQSGSETQTFTVI